MAKIAMNLREHFGVLKCDLGDEFAGGDIATALGFKQIALSTNYRPLTETLKQIISRYLRSNMAPKAHGSFPFNYQ